MLISLPSRLFGLPHPELPPISFWIFFLPFFPSTFHPFLPPLHQFISFSLFEPARTLILSGWLVGRSLGATMSTTPVTEGTLYVVQNRNKRYTGLLSGPLTDIFYVHVCHKRIVNTSVMFERRGR